MYGLIIQPAAVSGPIPPTVEIRATDWATQAPTDIAAVCFQGMWFKRFDKFHFDEVGGRVRARCWYDIVGHSWALEVVFDDIAPDPAFDGEENTSIAFKVYAEGDAVADWTGRVPSVFDFADFEQPPNGTRDGLSLTDERYDEHLAALPSLEWRDWSPTV